MTKIVKRRVLKKDTLLLKILSRRLCTRIPVKYIAGYLGIEAPSLTVSGAD
jgi:hypothetical protein